MASNFNSGLSLQASRNQPIYLTHIGGLAAVLEIRVRSTYPGSQEARIRIGTHGERCDLKALGIPDKDWSCRIGMEEPTEIIPGVQVIVRRNDLKDYVTRNSATIVINADPSTWLIERKVVMERRLKAQGRPLVPSSGRNV
ncbi:hypothetical protein CU669_19630 [Paramagnetospirillum kuznetsovii]|jgi:hypothetical protein|uniref:Uncharacterized protein n=1 Tax=Paramagnetospirillum kuznetsovii TaxID=2053833 RepID=A0A364NT02_9PROT|nr:hypothetical protein [Paramagnetospirillum kuznetsovii]RAU20198.1 hypothetical protein CU669_19630 [Paramagnetospirillum kuznetsovii]